MPFAALDVPVDIRPDGLYELTAPLTWTGSKGDAVTVPAGFLSDLASVPRMFRALIDVAGRHDRAAIVHDFACESLRVGVDAGTPYPISPADVDGMFRAILHELGVGRLMRNFYWAGVRWGALGSYYRRAGWWGTLPRLLAVTVPLLWLLVPYVVVVSLVSALIDLIGLVVDIGDRPVPAVDPTLTTGDPS